MKRYLAGLGLMLLCLTGMSGTAQAASAECEGNLLTRSPMSAGSASFR